MSIGQVIRALRVERGLTQEELALEADVATSNISRIESGQRLPTFDVLRRLADALRTSVSRIHALAEEMAPDLPDDIEIACAMHMTPSDDELLHEILVSSPDNSPQLLLRYYRELSAENQHLVMEQIKLLRRLQKQKEAGAGK